MSIIIVTLIIQSTILSIYNGVTCTQQNYFLLFDIFLLLGQFGQNFSLILLIGSICLSNELLIAEENIKCYYLSMRFILSAHVLMQKQKSIYFLFCLFYLLFRSNLYLQPLSYLSIFGYLMILIQCQCHKLSNGNSKNSQTQQLFDFFRASLPIPLCIIQKNEFLFRTDQFITEYVEITPYLISQISSEKNKESINTYLSDKGLNNKNKSYIYEGSKILENCNVLQNNSQLEFYFNVRNYFPVDIEVAEVIWEQQPATMLIFQTQQQRNEKNQIKELQQRDQYKDEMLASVSHDFKTPINGIVAIVQFLESIVINQIELNYLIILKKWAQLLLYMISDILDFSRIQNNTLRLTSTPFLINVIVQEIIDLISLQANQKGIVVEKQITLEEDISMNSDPNRLKQILLNLLSNSLKFTEKGKIKIQVDYKNDELDNQFKIITISVQDTGVGIPDDIKPKLFQMYGTFDFTSNGSNKNGIGLGLFICKKLVGLLGPSDKINLKSQVGIGSTFSFDIYTNIDERNIIFKEYQKEMTNIYKQDTKQSLCAHHHTNFITSQYTIFNQTSNLTTIHYNQKGQTKKLNNKTISTQQEIYHSKQSHKTQQFRTLNPQKSSNKRMNTDNNISFNLEDSDNSKTRNIEQYLEYHNDITQAPYINKNQRNVEINNNNPMNSLFYQIESSESPAMHNMQRKPLQFTESIEDMMRILFPEPTIILVVDDSPVNVFAFRLIMQKYAFITIEEAYNGEQALQKIRMSREKDIKYQYIFMDLTMPILNGYEATEQIRIMEKDNFIEKSFIIALTGYDDLKEKEKCQQKGFDAFLSKPIKIIDIISVVNEVKSMKDPLI
ncbi:unnamed protein product [Paramecium sonneborni]|uniref:Histidine kinase n=1 Tax=Paramecium sonneborni TaxID=65129 RepID=A0A8S1L807_9CILI|nr:unnamed protein product [Paramecium sonneborni]